MCKGVKGGNGSQVRQSKTQCQNVHENKVVGGWGKGMEVCSTKALSAMGAAVVGRTTWFKGTNPAYPAHPRKARVHTSSSPSSCLPSPI